MEIDLFALALKNTENAAQESLNGLCQSADEVEIEHVPSGGDSSETKTVTTTWQKLFELLAADLIYGVRQSSIKPSVRRALEVQGHVYKPSIDTIQNQFLALFYCGSNSQACTLQS